MRQRRISASTNHKLEVIPEKKLKIEIAGPYVDVIVYPISKGRENPAERKRAGRCSSELRQKANDRTSIAKFRRLMAQNFSPRDLVVTLTYSDAALPATPERARDKHLKPFIKKLRDVFREADRELKYMYVTEGLHGDHRLHHHIIVPDLPDLRPIVRNLWAANGTNVDFEPIWSRGYDIWAGYLTKEPRKTGRHRAGARMWTPSRNLLKPEVITETVADDYIYEPPSGVVIDLNETIQTEWWTCQYISYRVPSYLAKN